MIKKASKLVNNQSGFTLIEIMIALALGLVISAAVIQVLVSNSMTDKLNRAVASTQESGRYVIRATNTGITAFINENAITLKII